jgi:UDP-N-acetylmuramyl pentapeptide phosphotransferase/UDP-N-acetylglucosamine-1-phosphate transferase
VTTVVYPFVLRYALNHNIVDNPDARKIHRQPIPVMGGVAVYAGILAGCLAMWFLIERASLSWSLMAITTMLVLGVWDDMKNLPAVLRLIVQFGIVGGYMALTGYHIHNFYGLFGIHEISLWVGIPLSKTLWLNANVAVSSRISLISASV